VPPLNAEQRRARGKLAARGRWGGDVSDEVATELEQSTTDQKIDELVARAPRMTPEQVDRIRRLFKYAPAEQLVGGT
jgi:hypothetical protein